MPVSIMKKIGSMFSLDNIRWGRGRSHSQQPLQNDGKRPNDGPPDLDQMWRDFNARLNRLFSNKGGGDSGGGGGFKPDMRGAGVGAAVIAVIVSLLWVASGYFIVPEGQTAVVLTFGKYSHSTPAGFNWRWPYPIQSHELVNVSEVRTVEIGISNASKARQASEALMLTDDENIIDIQFAVQYKLKDAFAWVFNNRDQESTVKQVAETAIREVVGKSKMDFVLYEGREQVAKDVTQSMQQILDHYDMGVQITNVTMQGVQPPEQVQAAFDDAVKAGQDRERQKNEGQAYANDVIPKAAGAASRLMQESQAYKARVIANAEGDASRFKQVLAEYQKAPAVTRDRMYLETMQQIFANTTKVMVDSKSNSNMIYLPLDKLISQSASNEAATKGSVTVQAPVDVNPAPDPLQSLDAQRLRDPRSRDSRDREVR
ncbi:MAG TPA: FtsH protease activity modulator HflK [Burkholderiaceae bacterium]|jgi:membrane protease subunit HflK|nr:FtsH protease activity modulator HflK [Burkholderiaceae bacterium]